MPVTMTFSGEDVSEVFAQMREALRDDRPVCDSMREAIDASLLKLHKAAEAAMANAEQYDADKAAKAYVSYKDVEDQIDAEAAERANEVIDALITYAEKVEKTTRQRKPKEEPAAEPVAEQAQEPVTGEAASAPAATLDYTKDIAPAVIAYNTKNGREATIALLGEFGASNAKDIKPDLWPELLERLS